MSAEDYSFMASTDPAIKTGRVKFEVGAIVIEIDGVTLAQAESIRRALEYRYRQGFRDAVGRAKEKLERLMP